MQGPYCPRPERVSQNNEHVEGETNRGRGKKAKSAAFFYSLRKYYERDSAYLGLIEAFIQDGPQLILQLYILAVRDSETSSDENDKSDTYVGKKYIKGYVLKLNLNVLLYTFALP